MRWARRLLLLLLVASILPPRAAAQRLHYLTTAQQFGPVSFRDPLGVLSPDGSRFAWSVQQHLYVRATGGGPVRELETEPGLVLQLVWLPDGRGIAAGHRFGAPYWWRYDLASGGRAPLFAEGQRVSPDGPPADSLRQLAWSADGKRFAGVRAAGKEWQLWASGVPGREGILVRSPAPLSFPVFAPDGHLACLIQDAGRPRVADPCLPRPAAHGPEAYGPLAFSPGGDTLYYASPNPGGTLDLWARPRGRAPLRLTSFARDSYAPSVGRDGSVFFKVQQYRTTVGVLPAGGGPVTPITAFQSETPSWDPTSRWIGITYGTWRRVVDDFGYPDIAQDIGIVPASPPAPALRVDRVVDASPSEDQSLHWSPNGRWIAYHSHKDQGDDVWLVPADRSRPARRLTRFGRGFETGWPRWSPDGKWLLFDADGRDGGRRSVIYVMGIDQESGTVTAPERALAFDGFSGEAVHAEWLPDSRGVAVLGDESADRHIILISTRDGGPARVLHRWT
ncbi:MAG TPA: hypothetical protein VL241_05910, partial [Gemmatimonadales bacterium]|nr:hypothetical protein [Gemmatimonadales bacterium]